MKIILGSKSFGRKSILEQAGYTFAVMVSNIDEKAIRSENYEELPLLIAREKTKALIDRIHEPALLITSDQIVICNGELREKPENKAQAKAYLESYALFSAQTITAVVVTNTATGKQVEGVDTAQVYFKSLPSSVIDEIVAQGDVMHAAGGFIVNHTLLEPHIARIEGEKDSVIGLPLALTEKLLEEVK